MNSRNRLLPTKIMIMILVVPSNVNALIVRPSMKVTTAGGGTMPIWWNHGAKPSTSTTRLSVLWDPLAVTETDPEGLVDFPTPMQRTELKKEAQRRSARRELVSVSIPPQESNGRFSYETYQTIWSALTQHELIVVKGIAPNRRKAVHGIALRLCEKMEEWLVTGAVQDFDDSDDDNISDMDDEMEEAEEVINDVDVVNDDDDGIEEDDDDDDVDPPFLPVALLSTKGHTALIYCPTLPLNHPNKFLLRTSVGQKNVWTARIKAPRDHRGQIIKDTAV